MEGGKQENPEKNPQSTGEITLLTKVPSSIINTGLYPGGHPSSYIKCIVCCVGRVEIQIEI